MSDDSGKNEKDAKPGSPEYVKKLVRMNPSMKPPGFDTTQAADHLVATMQQAKAQAAGAAAKSTAPKSPPPNPTTKSPPPSGSEASFVEALLKAKEQLASETNRLAQERTALQTALAALDTETEALPARICDELVDTLLAVDRNMTSPKTQFVLKSEKAFLQSIGFSVERVVTREKKR